MHQAPAEPVHRHRQCQNAQVMLQDHQIYKTRFKMVIYFYALACVQLTLFSVVVFVFLLFRIEKPLSTVQTGRQGRPGGRVPTIRSRGQAISDMFYAKIEL